MSYISEDFTPWASLSGGIVLGVSTTLYLLFAGRITGMSGILNGVLTFEQGSLHWKSLYVVCSLSDRLVTHTLVTVFSSEASLGLGKTPPLCELKPVSC